MKSKFTGSKRKGEGEKKEKERGIIYRAKIIFPVKFSITQPRNSPSLSRVSSTSLEIIKRTSLSCFRIEFLGLFWRLEGERTLIFEGTAYALLALKLA